jgi:hypothetical protein
MPIAKPLIVLGKLFHLIISKVCWRNWIAHLTTDQEVLGSSPRWIVLFWLIQKFVFVNPKLFSIHNPSHFFPKEKVVRN